jgi:hypothetical protein
MSQTGPVGLHLTSNMRICSAQAPGTRYPRRRRETSVSYIRWSERSEDKARIPGLSERRRLGKALLWQVYLGTGAHQGFVRLHYRLGADCTICSEVMLCNILYGLDAITFLDSYREM